MPAGTFPTWEPLPPARFDAFHAEFQGDTWDACTHCGGKCEIHKVGSLMPGEADYIAARLGMGAQGFRDRYLDGILTPYGVVDVLKLKAGCPFLDACFRCTIAAVKVVLCEVYPVVFEVEDDRARFELDPWCPLARCVPALAHGFRTRGIAAIERLGAPVSWYRAVALYDSLCVDYDALSALRAASPGYTVLDVADLSRCLATESVPEDIDPARLVAPATARPP